MQAQGFDQDPAVVGALCGAYAAAGNHQVRKSCKITYCTDILSQQGSYSYSLDFCNQAALRCCRGREAEISAVVQTFPCGMPKLPMWFAHLCYCNMQAIEDLIEQAKAAGLPPVLSAYTSLIKAYGLNSSLTDVRRVLLEMKEDNVQPNQLHYRAAIAAHGQAGRPLEAQVLHNMLHLKWHVNEH